MLRRGRSNKISNAIEGSEDAAHPLIPAVRGEQVHEMEPVEGSAAVDLDARDLAFGESDGDQEDFSGASLAICGDRVVDLGINERTCPLEALARQAEDDRMAPLHRLADLIFPVLAREDVLIPPDVDPMGGQVGAQS